jgi:hypothetical protein
MWAVNYGRAAVRVTAAVNIAVLED